MYQLIEVALIEYLRIFSRPRNILCWVHLRGPVIQANGRLIFEDDLRSATLHYTVNQHPQWPC